MDDKPLLWLRYALPIMFILTLAFATFIFLRAGSSQPMTLWQFIPVAILGGLIFLLELFVKYDLSTWLSIIFIAAAFILFYLGFKETNSERKAALIGFAGAVLGFGTGMPVGHYASKIRKSK